MRFSLIDWSIVFFLIGSLLFVSWRLKSRVQSVSDFLSANRCAGRYLLTVSQGMAAVGAISLVANWEKFYQAGFGAAFWGLLLGPIGMVIALTGWVQYRYRETQALTLAQFFEMRYSRRFRVFAGSLAWFSGILNYGIFPGVTARFIINFTGLPPMPVTVPVVGISVDLMLGFVMAIMLGMALFITLSAGQIAVMVSDFLQGIFYYGVFIAIVLFLFFHFGWDNIIETLRTAAPDQQSMINPFDQAKTPDFNIWFFVMVAFMAFYGKLAWQGTSGYYSAAKSPHEARMAGVLADWRTSVMYLLPLLLPICAFVLLHGGGDASVASKVTASLDAIADPKIREQMNTPIALSFLLPSGLTAFFLTAICSLAISTDSTYLHSWGSIFVQDVLTPLRKKPLTTEAHLLWLRRSIFGVAVFVWCFSMVFRLQEYILMYFMVTGAIFTGGAGSVIIGGLYWNRGTTAAAWSALISGGVFAVSGILVNNVLWPRLLPMWKTSHPDWAWINSLPDRFWLNGAQLAFMAALLCFITYVTVSLLTCRKPFDLNKMLHRTPDPLQKPTSALPKTGLRFFHMGPSFTRGDKIIYIMTIAWTAFFFGATLIIIFLNQIKPLSSTFWSIWWFVNLILGIVAAGSTFIWFMIGGIRDLRDLLKMLSTEHVDKSDDGQVK